MLSFNSIGNLGRIGNQMFQFATLKGISRNRGYDFCIPPREYFGVNDDNVKSSDFIMYDLFNIEENNNMSVGNFPRLPERMFNFDNELLFNCPDNVDLFGYYQCEKYFEHIKTKIKEDFSFVDNIWNPCGEMFQFDEVISLHIRRSDYVEKQSYHPLCPLEYYEVALTKLPQDIPVLIFSDDPNWCMNQELFQPDRFMVSESDNNRVDMCLMTMCSYHIIANSSFSWWGAWLADSKKVIAPKVWFGPSANLDDSDLVPESWERI